MLVRQCLKHARRVSGIAGRCNCSRINNSSSNELRASVTAPPQPSRLRHLSTEPEQQQYSRSSELLPLDAPLAPHAQQQEEVAEPVGSQELQDLLAQVQECAVEADWQKLMNICAEKPEQPRHLAPAEELRLMDAAMVTLSRATQWQRAARLTDRLRRRGVRFPDTSFVAGLRSYSKCGQYREAASFVREQHGSGYNVQSIHHVAVTLAYLKAKRTKDAYAHFQSHVLPSVRRSTQTVNAQVLHLLMKELVAANLWKAALDVLTAMKAAGVEPDEYAYGHAVRACQVGHDWQRALQLIHEMQNARIPDSSYPYLSAW